MKIINRGFISVIPKTNFIKEVINNTQSANVLTPSTPEPSVYLVEEDFWDDEIILKKYHKKIISTELRQIEPEKNIQVEHINFDNFHEYFEVNMGNLVFDLEDQSIQRLTDD
jgi:hypothetical protein